MPGFGCGVAREESTTQNRILDGEMEHHKEVKGMPDGSRFVSPYLLRPLRTYAEALADLRALKQQALPPDQPPCNLREVLPEPHFGHEPEKLKS